MISLVCNNETGDKLRQYDLNRRIVVYAKNTVEEIWFRKGGLKLAVPFIKDGEGVIAEVPNIMLKEFGVVTTEVISIAEDGVTHNEKQNFYVHKRGMPAGYIYTETETIGVLNNDGGGQPDWNAAEGEPGHVKNRTHGSEFVWHAIVENQAVAADDFDEQFTENENPFYYSETENSVYFYEEQNVKIVFNGKEYKGVLVNNEWYEGHVFGNLAIVEVGEDTGEPFLYGDGGSLFTKTNEPFTISVYVEEEVVTQLPNKYIPPDNYDYVLCCSVSCSASNNYAIDPTQGTWSSVRNMTFDLYNKYKENNFPIKACIVLEVDVGSDTVYIRCEPFMVRHGGDLMLLRWKTESTLNYINGTTTLDVFETVFAPGVTDNPTCTKLYTVVS